MIQKTIIGLIAPDGSFHYPSKDVDKEFFDGYCRTLFDTPLDTGILISLDKNVSIKKLDSLVMIYNNVENFIDLDKLFSIIGINIDYIIYDKVANIFLHTVVSFIPNSYNKDFLITLWKNIIRCIISYQNYRNDLWLNHG